MPAPDGKECEDEEEGVQAVEEAVGHELLQLARDLQERVDLERPKKNQRQNLNFPQNVKCVVSPSPS